MHSHNARTRHLGLAAAAVALVLSAAACSSDDGTQKKEAETTPLPQAEWSTLELPVGKLQGGTSVSNVGGLSASGKLPYVLFDMVGKPGRAYTTVARTSTDARAWTAHPVVDDPDSYVSATATDGRTTTVAVGSSWKDGRFVPWLATSSDRTSWKRQPVPDDDGFTPGGVALVDGKPLAVGLDGDKRLRALLPGADSLSTLPEAPGGAKLSGVDGATAHGQRVVAVLDGRAGSDIAVFAAVSDNAGKDWTIKRILRDKGASAAGITSVGNDFVVTGSVSVGGTDGAAAWSSTDGTSWKREQLPPLLDATSGWSTHLSAPHADGASVVAGLDNQVSLRGGVLTRTPAGRWSSTTATAAWNAPGTSTVAIGGPHGVVTSRDHDGQVQLGRGSSGTWSQTATLGLRHNSPSWSDATLLHGSPLVTVQRRHVQLKGDGGWSQSDDSQLLAASGRTLRLASVQPAAARDVRDPATQSDDQGNSVTLGWRLHEGDGSNDTDVVGWFKPAHGPWVRATGLDGPRTEFLSGVKWLGHRWVAWGSDRADWESTAHTGGIVWESTDGKRWRVVSDAGFDPSTSQDSWVNDVCLTPHGELALTGTEDPARGSVPGALRRTAKGWVRVSLAKLGKDLTSVSGCTTVGKTTLLQGYDSDGSSLWRTRDLTSWSALDVGGSGDTIGTVRETPSGFAAPGYLGGGNQGQPVVWLSPDGTSWRPVEVPSDIAVNVSDVLPWGKKLVVLTSSQGGPGAEVLNNPADLYEEISAD